MQTMEEEEKGSFGFKQIDAADNYTAALLKDGTIYTWGMNDRGQMGVGSGIGVDLVESERTPKQLDFTYAFGNEPSSEPIIITQVTCGQNTMLMRDHKNRLFKTGLKLDYTPKYCRFNQDLLKNENIDLIACGRTHYVILDKENNMHTFGKIIKTTPIANHEGFDVHDADKLFDGGRVKQLSMQYEIFSALVEDK